MIATAVALIALGLVPSLLRQSASPAVTHSISGRVLDSSTGKPLSDAVVVLWDRAKTRAAGRRVPVGANGVFELTNVPPGAYQLAAEVPGAGFSYRTQTVDVEVSDGSVTGLGLLITPFGPRSVTVSGRLVLEGGGRIPASLTRISNGLESGPVQTDGSFQLRFRADEKYPIALENLPEGYYVKAVSAGSWSAASDTLSFAATPPSTLRITLALGARRIRGRILDSARVPAGTQTTVTLAGPTASTRPRNVTLNADGTFNVSRLRPGNYELRARRGTGKTTEFASLRVSVANQDPPGIELALKRLTPQRGRVVIEGVGRVEELARFRPWIEVVDVLGTHRIPIGSNGTFEFESFENEYSVSIQDLPFEYDPSVVVDGSSVEIKLRIIQGDAPFFVRPPRR